MPSDRPAAALIRPASATHGGVALAGLVTFLAATAAVGAYAPAPLEFVAAAGAIIGCTALVVIALDVGWQRIHRRASTGLDYAHDDPSLARTGVKYLGLLGSLAGIGGLYWLFPEYHAPFYDRYWALLRALVPAWLLVAFPYLYFVDRHQREPHDGYWHVGRLLTGRLHGVERAAVWQHGLGWLIKGFFLPLMFTYFCNDLDRLIVHGQAGFGSFPVVYDFLYDGMYFIDVGLVSMGYLVALRLTDTHLRSAEPTLLGWVVALACYEPFWSLLGSKYLAYGGAHAWGWWLAGYPYVYVPWGLAILALTAVYVWATVSFGARFSNLTHRGIITNGPYRYTKHPAYLAKNLSWWLISLPFLAGDSVADGLRHAALLLLVNGVYWLRAMTEERHLACDPAYVSYARFIEAHGLFRRRPA